MDALELEGTADSLAEMLRQIDAGKVKATKTQRAYLLGAEHALRAAAAE